MKPLFLTAHYDDLEVCAGGTASRYGGTSLVIYPKYAYGKQTEAYQAAERLGITTIEAERYIGNRNLINFIDALAETKDTIITTSPYDSHPEHQKVAALAAQAARKNRKALWYMDHAIPGGYTDSPRPNKFVDITGHMPHKRASIRCYESAVKAYGTNWLETIAARDTYYGRIHGVVEAEGFIVTDSIL